MKRIHTLLWRSLYVSSIIMAVIFTQNKKVIADPFTSSVHTNQNNTVTGRVTLSDGTPLFGVNVTVKGTQRTVNTNDNGQYTINVPANKTLVFTYLGFKRQEIQIGGKVIIDVVLVEESTSLDDVVVVGYGTMEKSDLTGSVSQVKLKNVNETKAVSISEALQGKLAGVNIVTNTGEPGGAITFNIRGMTSVTGSNQPLIVIDGQPIESSFGATYAGSALDGGADAPPSDPLAALNTNDIESIEVLKDASSTAMYGSRGANGVVLITTKSGSSGKDRIVYSTRWDMSKLPNQLEMLSSYEYMMMRNEANVNDGKNPIYSDLQLDSISKSLNINWQDEVYRKAIAQDHQISFSGKDDKSTYLLSGNYSDQQSIIQNAAYRKGGARLNYQRKISPKLTVGLRTFISLADRKFGLQSNWTGILGSTVVMGALSFNPLINPYDPETGDYDEDLVNGPLLLINKVTDRTKIQTILSKFNADYNITNNLTYTLSAGINQINSIRSIFYPTGTFIGDTAPRGSATRADNTNSNYLIDNILTFKKRYADKHAINVMAGFSYQHWFRESTSTTGLGFPSNTLSYFQLTSAAFPGRTYFNPDPERVLQSVIGRANYVYDKRYLFTLTGRYDGSSRLAPGNQWDIYPSLGLGWNVSNEKFFKDRFDFISLLKVRASAGVTGNDNIAAGGSQASYGLNFYPFGPTINPTYVMADFENPKLKWERTAKYNVGLDFGFLKDKLTLTVDYYKHITTDLLINLSLPGSAGYGSYFTNVGKIMNQGLDIESAYNTNIGKVNLNIGANFSTFNNKVISLGDGNVIYGRNFFVGGATLLGQSVTAAFVGEQISNFYGYKTDGIYQNQAEIDSDPALAKSNKAGVKPGMIKYIDSNGDGQISEGDQTIIGSPTPDFTYGFNANISYKAFSATINIFGNYGSQLMNLNRWMVGSNHANTNHNSFRDTYYGRWHGEGTSNLYPQLTTNSVRLQQRLPDWMVEDASFVRLQNITLGYDFKLPKKFKGAMIKAFLTGTNLLTLTKYSGYDPNINSFGQSSLTNGLDLGTLPQARSYSAGITLTF